MNRELYLNGIIRGYIGCMLWSTHGPEEGPYKCSTLDDLFDEDDLSPELVKQIREDCEDFYESNLRDCSEFAAKTNGYGSVGHDFWLTRNRHGAGFWDRGFGELGERLSDAARSYGTVDVYPCDDGKLYA